MSSAQEGKWSVGLCQCGDNLGTCCLASFLPCVAFGRIAEVVDEGQTSCVLNGFIYGLLCSIQAQWVYSCMYRKKLRTKFGLEAEPCNDCCVHFCCEPFALCQEHAELKKFGLDPSKGWVSQPTTAPVPPLMNK